MNLHFNEYLFFINKLHYMFNIMLQPGIKFVVHLENIKSHTLYLLVLAFQITRHAYLEGHCHCHFGVALKFKSNKEKSENKFGLRHSGRIFVSYHVCLSDIKLHISISRKYYACRAINLTKNFYFGKKIKSKDKDEKVADRRRHRPEFQTKTHTKHPNQLSKN